MNVKEVAVASLSAVKRRDREGWLALFAEDATVEDPVGPYVWDPEGKGQQGKEAIAAFYDMFADCQESFDYEIHHMATGGNEVAVVVTLHIAMKDGAKHATKAINIYKVTPEGKIQSLRAFWNE